MAFVGYNYQIRSGDRIGELVPVDYNYDSDESFQKFAEKVTIGAGIGFVGAALWKAEIISDPRKLKYLNAQYSSLGNWWEILGREQVSEGKYKLKGKDFALDIVKSIEESLFKIPRTFSVYPFLSELASRSENKINLNLKGSALKTYRDYIEKAIGRDLSSEELNYGLNISASESGEGLSLYSNAPQRETLLKKVSLVPTYWEGSTNFAAGAEHRIRYGHTIQEVTGVRGSYNIKFPFVPRDIGDKTYNILGETVKVPLIARDLHDVAHDSSVRYLRLLDDPLEAFYELMFPNEATASGRALRSSRTKNFLYRAYDKLLKNRLGTGGDFTGNLSDLWLRHAGKITKFGAVTYGGYTVLDSITRTATGYSPEQILGTVAYGAQSLIAETSDILGLTDLSEEISEINPALSSPLSTIGVIGSAGITGSFSYMTLDRIKGSGNNNDFFWAHINREVEAPSWMKNIRDKIPHLNKIIPDKMSPGRLGFTAGALLGAGLMLPFLPFQLGFMGGADQLERRASGEEFVPVRRGRWWEGGKTAFEGADVEGYKPHWYFALMADAEKKAIYGEYYDDPITRVLNTIEDPYWVEKMHYHDRPYPMTGSLTSGFGPLGTLWDMTLGRVFKPTMMMHEEDYLNARGEMLSVDQQYKNRPSLDLEGYGPTAPVMPDDVETQARSFAYRTSEALGLRGFFFSSMIDAEDYLPNQPIMQNASEIDSVGRNYYEMRLGGGLTTCFPAGSFVRTREGMTDIKDIQVGDTVWSMGEWKKVIDKFDYAAGAYLFDIETADGFTMSPTGNHIIPVLRRLDKTKPFNDENIEILEIAASEIKEGDYLFRPINRESTNIFSEYSKDFPEDQRFKVECMLAEIFGIVFKTVYGRDQFQDTTATRHLFRLNAAYTRLLLRLKSLVEQLGSEDFKVLNPEKITSGKKERGDLFFTIDIKYWPLAQHFLNKNGKKKRIPKCIQDLDPRILVFFLKSLISNICSNVGQKDPVLVYQIYELFLKIGVVPSMYLQYTFDSDSELLLDSSGIKISQLKFNQIEQDRLARYFSSTDPQSIIIENNRYPFYADMQLVKVESVIKTSRKPAHVYDITVEDIHFYTVNGIMVHNTEAFRRIFPRKSHLQEDYNPIQNTMPTWLRFSNEYKNLGLGDPYSKILQGDLMLPGMGFEAMFPELSDVSYEDYPDVFKFLILANASPYSDEVSFYKQQVERQIQGGELSDKYVNLYIQGVEMLESKESKKQFAPEPDSLAGEYYGLIQETLRMSPFEHLIPIAPMHKFGGPVTAEQDYLENRLLSKEYPSWDRPIEDFLAHSGSLVLNGLGGMDVSEEAQSKENINAYFDSLEFIKYRRLENQALYEGDTARASLYKGETGKTFVGSSSYSDTRRIKSLIGLNDYAYLESFMAEEDPEKLRKYDQMLPGYHAKFLSGSFAKSQLQAAVELSQQEGISIQGIDKIAQSSNLDPDSLRLLYKQLGDNEKSKYYDELAAKRREDLAALIVNQMGGVPDNDWIGWRDDVDLEDIKLRVVEDRGYNYHDFNLWETRERTLRRKPYIRDAANELNRKLSQDLAHDNIDNLFRSNEIRDVQSFTRGLGLNDSVILQYNHDYRANIKANMEKEELINGRY